MQDYKSNAYGYQVDGKFYQSKIRALDIAKGDINKLRLYFCDKEWSQVDWTAEPTQSMGQLIDIRCRQLRDSYKHVALFFSGGYDSTTILNGFIRNNLRIDQIIVWDRVWINDICTTEINYALSVAKKLKQTMWPNLLITHWKLDINSVNNFYLKHKENWIEYAGDHIAAQKSIRNYQLESHSDFFSLHEQKDKVIIEGRDKPRLHLENGKWYAMMNDKLLKFSMNNNAEQFYYSPTFPDLYLKQCHRAIEWLEKNLPNPADNLHNFMSHNVDPVMYKNYNLLALERDPVPEYTGGAGAINKRVCKGGIKSHDSKNCQSILDAKCASIWENGIIQIKKLFPNAWNEEAKELHTVVSEKKFLRNFMTKTPTF